MLIEELEKLANELESEAANYTKTASSSVESEPQGSAYIDSLVKAMGL